MGGSSYDRDDYDSSSSSSWRSSSGYGGSTSSFGESAYSHTKFKSSSIDSSMQPKGKVIKSETKNPIVIMLDVTGSNINFARVVYDKLPMFYGQIEQKGYLKDFDISICATGDATCDSYPLQVSDFAKGIEIDSWIEKTYLEGGGGPGDRESYELAAFWLYKNMEVRKDSRPLIFFIADEGAYDKVNRDEAEAVGIDMTGVQEADGFKELRNKVKDNVYVLLNRDSLTDYWKTKVNPQHVINIKEEKAIIDLMLGIISMSESSRDLDSYKVDMIERGQDTMRITGVTSSLEELSKSLVPVAKVDGLVKTSPNSTSGSKAKRL